MMTHMNTAYTTSWSPTEWSGLMSNSRRKRAANATIESFLAKNHNLRRALL